MTSLFLKRLENNKQHGRQYGGVGEPLIYGINKSYVQCNLNKNILPFCNINISELVTAMGFHKAHMISM